MGIKKQVDNRIRTTIENGVTSGHRTFFVIVGDHGKDQVVNLYYMLTKTIIKTKPSVLWCYKKELGFSSNRKKRMEHIKKLIKKGLYDPNKDDPFELFISSTKIRWTYYKDTDKILGNTYGMCVLQDFEAITPNILARTIETVEGGGIVILLLKTMTSLKQLYTMTMDSHQKFKTESHQDIKARFNERFLLSLSSCNQCLVMDDELNILPISRSSRNIEKIEKIEEEEDAELNELKETNREEEIIGPIIMKAKTLDQGKAILTMIESISDKKALKTIALTASRGRGKSAALGLSIASAVAYGYSNIFVTSPSSENVKTLFEFIIEGMKILDYKEHIDYDIVKQKESSNNNNSTSSDVIVRINIYRSHRQTIQYISPDDSKKLGQAELLVIDEAAAIPLPKVKALLGPYLVFISSTINGYEGTGRSLSLKLIKQIREQSGEYGGRVLKEISLQDPIRYKKDDPVEKWLNSLLCLDSTTIPKPLASTGCPHPSQCDLYYVNRDTLFSYHSASELFLQRMVSLFVSSHYKNSPNDLLLMADAPAHHLFVLLPPIDKKNAKTLPDILCVIQVCLEGGISRESVLKASNRGQRSSGDLIPWTLSQQFQDEDFPNLNGGRIIRIATHPDYQKMGYGSHALNILKSYYKGDIIDINEGDGNKLDEENVEQNNEEPVEESVLIHEDIKPRKKLPPLLLSLNERRPEKLHYIGVSFGLTDSLFKFWKKAGFVPTYIRQTQNELTGEYTCIMVHQLNFSSLNDEIRFSNNWLAHFSHDFRRRFLSLLSYEFSKLPCELSLLIHSTKADYIDEEDSSKEIMRNELNHDTLKKIFSDHDLKRLDRYSNNLIDYHVIIDLLPSLSNIFFNEMINKDQQFNISPAQSLILLGLGNQHKNIDDIAKELNIKPNQVMALLNKVIRKFSKLFNTIEEEYEGEKLPSVFASKDKEMNAPITDSIHNELENKGSELIKEMNKNLMDVDDDDNNEKKKKKNSILDEINLPQYAIDSSLDWQSSEKSLSKKKKIPNIVSVKKIKKTEENNEQQQDQQQSKGSAKKNRKHKRKRDDSIGESQKKKHKKR